MFADLARDGARPARPDFSHVDQFLPFVLAEVECGDTGGILDESNNGKFPLLDGLDLQPALIAL